jgi:hypothetical protein
MEVGSLKEFTKNLYIGSLRHFRVDSPYDF